MNDSHPLLDEAVVTAFKEAFSSPFHTSAGDKLLAWLSDLAEGNAETDRDAITRRVEMIYKAFDASALERSFVEGTHDPTLLTKLMFDLTNDLT